MTETMKLETTEEALRNALAWYGEQARLARLVHSEGDPGRWALAEDGGKRAREVLALSLAPQVKETPPPSTHVDGQKDFHVDRLSAILRELWAAKSVDLHMCSGDVKADQFGLLQNLREDIGQLLAAHPSPVQHVAPEIDGGRFEEWSLADFAAQCRMQSREQLDPEFSRFMAALSARLSALSPAPAQHVAWGDWTVDDTDTAREILNYLGHGSDASREPGADRRRDKIAAMIRARVDAATAPAPQEHVAGLEQIGRITEGGSIEWFNPPIRKGTALYATPGSALKPEEIECVCKRAICSYDADFGCGLDRSKERQDV